MYESLGYIRWGEHPDYALVRGKTVRGFFYYKRLRPREVDRAEHRESRP